MGGGGGGGGFFDNVDVGLAALVPGVGGQDAILARKTKKVAIDDPMEAAKEAGQKALNVQEELANKMYQRQSDEKATAEANSVRDEAKKKKRSLEGQSSGRAGTILTSPLGITGAAGGSGGKTLLGS
jgi:hypothetical protein